MPLTSIPYCTTRVERSAQQTNGENPSTIPLLSLGAPSKIYEPLSLISVKSLNESTLTDLLTENRFWPSSNTANYKGCPAFQNYHKQNNASKKSAVDRVRETTGTNTTNPITPSQYSTGNNRTYASTAHSSYANTFSVAPAQGSTATNTTQRKFVHSKPIAATTPPSSELSQILTMLHDITSSQNKMRSDLNNIVSRIETLEASLGSPSPRARKKRK